VSCPHRHGIDLAEYLVEPAADRWAEFRAHYPTCADCSREVASWSNLERVLGAASVEAGRAHPAEELLLAFHRSPEALAPEERASLDLHLEGCPACRDALTALEAFDFNALQAELGEVADSPATAEPSPPQPARSRLWELVLGLGEWLKSLGAPIPTPALVMALLLLLAIPSALVVWSVVRRPSALPPNTTAALESPRPPVAVEPAPEVSEFEPEVEAPGELVPPASKIALRPIPPVEEDVAPPLPPAEVAQKDAPEESSIRPAPEPPAPAASEQIAEVLTPPATQPLRELEPDSRVEPSLQELLNELEEEAAGSQREVVAIAMAESGTPRYAVPPGSVGPARRISRMRAALTAVPSLVALVPDHVGLTLHERPTLYWFISEDTDLSARLTLNDQKSIDPVLEFIVDGPLRAGIHSVRLSDHQARLEPGVKYEWFVSLAPRGEPRAYAALSAGAIQRVEPSEDLRAEIGATASSRLGHVYAQRGFWYDALAVFSRWVERIPAEGTMRQQRAALLEQVGLDEAADFDRSSAGTSEAK